MGFVRRAKLDLDFIARCALRIGEQQVEPTGSWLTALNVPDRQIAETQERRIILEDPLEPAFAEFAGVLEADWRGAVQLRHVASIQTRAWTDPVARKDPRDAQHR